EIRILLWLLEKVDPGNRSIRLGQSAGRCAEGCLEHLRVVADDKRPQMKASPGEQFRLDRLRRNPRRGSNHARKSGAGAPPFAMQVAEFGGYRRQVRPADCWRIRTPGRRRQWRSRGAATQA